MLSTYVGHLCSSSRSISHWGRRLALADSGASYHTTFEEKDFDKGTIQECDITVRIGDNNTVRITRMGQCSRTTEEGRKIILTKVLLSPQCPIRILSVGKLTSGGRSLYTQDDSSIRLLHKDSKELILKGTLSQHDTCSYCCSIQRRKTYVFDGRTNSTRPNPYC